MKCAVGDRVRVYSTFNGQPECPTATVIGAFPSGILRVRLDWFVDTDGMRVPDSAANAFVHEGQCRKLRHKNKVPA